MRVLDSLTDMQRGTRIATWAGRFRRSEDGGMIIFALFIFVLMLMIGGMAVDLMRFETTRTKLQGTLDRAVLAAADLDQTRPPIEVVRDYFAKAGMANYLQGAPTVQQGLNYRVVSANARVDVPMYFMGLMGIPSIPAPAVSTAEERVAKVEISLVLDISGSMANNNKMQNLQVAAGEFIDSVLTPQNRNLISVSLIPYSEHVNAGPRLYNRLNMTTYHNYSYCVEFPDSAFSTAAMSLTTNYKQMQHYQWNYSGSNDLTSTVCPRYSYEQITAWSQNASALKTQINSFQPRAGTSIFLGMKWATALLDPSMRSTLTNFIGNGWVDAAFSGRPVAYSDPETLKVVVLMTDGKNDRSYRIQNWAYDSSSEYAHWANYNLWWYLVRYVSSSSRSSYYSQRYTAAIGDTLTDAICDAAKAQGITIFSIGFEVDNHGADVLEQCASSPSHFYRVEGVEISDAFGSIAHQINNLKLSM